jgi:hypothetical protein
MAEKLETPAECPACRSPTVARIQYGLPMFTAELEKNLEEGRVVLGGCVIFGDDPEWQCKACGHQWGRIVRADDLKEGSA